MSNIEQRMIYCLSEFLGAVGGDWRNTIFIDCGECRDCKASGGVLLAADRDGKPLLLSSSDFRHMTGIAVDKAECLTVIGRGAYEALFASRLKWVADTANECGLRQTLTVGEHHSPPTT